MRNLELNAKFFGLFQVLHLVERHVYKLENLECFLYGNTGVGNHKEKK